MALAHASGMAARPHPWPTTDVLREHAPVVRLLGSLWAIPQVVKIGITLGAHSVDLWVFTGEDSPAVEATISAAERAYISEVCTHGFTLHVIPEGAVPEDGLPPYDTLMVR
jgi:hypothetical protein